MASVTIIGTRLVAGGTEVRILASTVEHATSLADELAGDGGSATGSGAQEPLVGDVIVLATPYEAALEIASARRDELAGKVVVDITNTVDWASFDGLVTPADSSGAEEIAKLATGARVVKAFNTTFAGTLQAGEVADHQLDVLLGGDDVAAKTQVAALVEAGGMRAIDAGPLRRAHQLEQLGFLHMALQEELGAAYGSTIKIVTP